ncbi:MAG: sporulation transcriptional regulator SpoIIID [Clostridia bacterium]|nr:sporulation transcriptional regulator SpoIIID [Clostridia bacterium]
MYRYIEERVLMAAQYIIENRATVRSCAKVFNVSKSTVHKDMVERLKRISPQMAEEVRRILNQNKEERHIRGGMATYRKYKG